MATVTATLESQTLVCMAIFKMVAGSVKRALLAINCWPQPMPPNVGPLLPKFIKLEQAGVTVGVKFAIRVRVGVRVLVGVFVKPRVPPVSVGEAVGVFVGVLVGVFVGEFVGVLVAV